MSKTNKIFRSITLGLQLIAIAAYFIPPLFMRGNVGIFWLVLGVIHTAIFSAVFFRNSRRRTALSIILMIIIIFWCLFLLALGLLLLSSWMPIASFSTMLIYSLCSFLAIIFALAGPRRFPKQATNTIP